MGAKFREQRFSPDWLNRLNSARQGFRYQNFLEQQAGGGSLGNGGKPIGKNFQASLLGCGLKWVELIKMPLAPMNSLINQDASPMLSIGTYNGQSPSRGLNLPKSPPHGKGI